LNFGTFEEPYFEAGNCFLQVNYNPLGHLLRIYYPDYWETFKMLAKYVSLNISYYPLCTIFFKCLLQHFSCFRRRTLFRCFYKDYVWGAWQTSVEVGLYVEIHY
jgi:hypothetical protein